MATIKFPTKGAQTIIKRIHVTDAFVQNSAVEAEIEQPKGSILSKVVIRCVSQPTVTVNASMDLGIKIGTATGGTEVFVDADGIIDAAANTTAFKTNGIVIFDEEDLGQVASAGNTAVAAATTYSSDERTLFCNTTATDFAIAAAGTVEWLLYFDIVGSDA